MTQASVDSSPAWRALQAHAERLRGVHLSALCAEQGRHELLSAQAPGIRLDFGRQRVVGETLVLLADLARERNLDGWRQALFAGKEINCTEGRSAWHTALRAGESAPSEVKSTLASMRAIADEVRRGLRRGATGRPVERLVHLGTGGSNLGSAVVVDALAEECDPGVDIRFVANIDPLEMDRALRNADPETTHFVVVSKTFTTQETHENALAALEWLESRLPGNRELHRHFIAITANSPEARRFGVTDSLPMWDWVGGRFSLWSAVGLTAMCAIGPDRFEQLLEGARDMDQHFAETPIERNVPVLMAMLGIWNVDFLGSPTHAVLPYSTALRLLPQHLQQLEMESNGKSVDRDGQAVSYATAPIVWGTEGTVGQHSFHQLLHQGTHCVPSDFIVFTDAPGDPRRRRMLAANAEAQATALAIGRTDPSLPAYRRYPGNKPSSMLHVDRLDARHLGRLIALYEHKVFVQGVIWNVNSFDQWGVEFGKELAAQLLART